MRNPGTEVQLFYVKGQCYHLHLTLHLQTIHFLLSQPVVFVAELGHALFKSAPPRANLVKVKDIDVLLFVTPSFVSRLRAQSISSSQLHTEESGRLPS